MAALQGDADRTLSPEDVQGPDEPSRRFSTVTFQKEDLRVEVAVPPSQTRHLLEVIVDISCIGGIVSGPLVTFKAASGFQPWVVISVAICQLGALAGATLGMHKKTGRPKR
ncbi:hypothetical protein GCM10023194_78270 [Planotetraspora phitsanulokensis]|uniref:Uncharacterized protein n=1 Tax=Planotetraspora phitsanulokensis TaxID=575192 RepID=A0A8J3U9B2_9ACTN|nr:hypothetical protein Pph01_61160 [Planotetraspora phitsanulokensis]